MIPIAGPSRSESGFTLLELLIAIAILGLILVALTNGVRFAEQAWQTQSRRIDRQGDVDAVQGMLRQLISSGRNFTGNAYSVQFVIPLPVALDRGGLHDVELRMLNDRLVLAWKSHFKGTAETAQRSVTELARNVTNLDLAYYVPGFGWQRNTTGKTPSLVRIAMGLDGDRSVASLVIAPIIDGNSSDAK